MDKYLLCNCIHHKLSNEIFTITDKSPKIDIPICWPNRIANDRNNSGIGIQVWIQINSTPYAHLNLAVANQFMWHVENSMAVQNPAVWLWSEYGVVHSRFSLVKIHAICRCRCVCTFLFEKLVHLGCVVNGNYRISSSHLINVKLAKMHLRPQQPIEVGHIPICSPYEALTVIKFLAVASGFPVIWL